MSQVPVDNFTFEFPDQWQVVEYDKCAFYRDQSGHLQGTKAVDVLAIGDNLLFIIEATDCRKFRIENKNKDASHELSLELAQKVRDTIAFLYGAYRNQTEKLRYFCDFLFAQTGRPKIKVVLLLEEDRPPTAHKSFEKARNALRLAVKKKFKYLNVRPDLYSCANVPSSYGWSVRCQFRTEDENEA